MIADVRWGTPNQLTSSRRKDASQTKSWARARIAEMEKWARSHNGEMADDLASIRTEIDALNLPLLRQGEVRRWSATDEHTGFTFVVEIEIVLR